MNEIEKLEIIPDHSLEAQVNNPLTSDDLKMIIESKDPEKLRTSVDEYDPHTIAIALSSLSPSEMVYFFRCLKADSSAPIFTLLNSDDKKRLIQAFTTDEIQKIVDEMSTDNVISFLDDLPANLVNKVLASAKKEDKERINTYLKFKEDSAGSIMTPEYLSFKDTVLVKEAIKKIKEVGKDMETIFMLFITDDTRRLIGTLRLDQLLEADENDVLKSIMNKAIVSLNYKEDVQEVVHTFRKYDISVLPVTNDSKRMLGIITYDDVIDVVNAENTEDIEIQAAVTPSEKPYMKRSVFQLVKGYALWIIILLILNTFTSSTISYLQNTLATIPVLTAFVPTIMGTNGNASDQTCTVITRELALGNITPKKYFKAVFKEFKASVITSFIMAIFSFAWILVELYSGIINMTEADSNILLNFYNGNTNLFYISLASLISLTFFLVIIIAKFLGVSLPVIAKLIHIDPALMSQPLISNILDIISVCVYVLLANLIMQGLGF